MTATQDTTEVVVDEPGVYDDMDEAEYHADPVPGGSLSASGAKLLLPPSCPARYHYDRMFGRPPKAEFDYGTAAHKYVLGAGPEIVPVDAPDWRTKAAKEMRDQARFEGKVPLLVGDLSEIMGMAAAIRRHPIAGPLLDPERGGKPEQSLFWQDTATGIWRRGRLDWLPTPDPLRRLLITDYKTTPDASPAAIRKHVANFSYHVQAAWYLEAANALGLTEFEDDAAFLFIFQEKTPPYLITVAELDEAAIEHGRSRSALACEIWRDCTQAGVWPGYTQDIELITLPPWAARTEGDLYS
jgi:hypothetical protein